ncbi:MAG: histidine--tRNA ligase [Cytophagales bacterium]|nr:histidine--tRNA ligase [Armatimonadota bacterium]
MRYTAPKGTHDILPSGKDRTDWADDITKWHWLEGIFRDLCALYGYEEVRTPIFEDTQLFHRAVGEGTDIVSKETYDFVTKGGDAITLRPEGTAGVLRAYVQNRVYLERPIAKLCYIGPNFRYERPTKGRYRQHYQAGIELLGASGPEADAEVIALLAAIFTRLGVSRLTLRLNSVGSIESRARYVEALIAYATPLVSQMSEDNQRRFGQNALRMLDSKEEQDQRLLADAPIVTDFLDPESREHFEALQKLLTTLGVDYKLDPFLVRGFDYYTRTLFEIESPDVGAQSSLAGGGRYNRLVEQLGGPATPGIGFGLGIERTLIALQTAKVPVPDPTAPVAFLCPIGAAARDACVILLSQLRGANLAADMDYTGRKLKASLEQADRVRARYALIVGDDEIAEGVTQVRDMQTKQQARVPIAHLAEMLRGMGGLPSLPRVNTLDMNSNEKGEPGGD